MPVDVIPALNCNRCTLQCYITFVFYTRLNSHIIAQRSTKFVFITFRILFVTLPYMYVFTGNSTYMWFTGYFPFQETIWQRSSAMYGS